jgi:hypothetical protein
MLKKKGSPTESVGRGLAWGEQDSLHFFSFVSFSVMTLSEL